MVNQITSCIDSVLIRIIIILFVGLQGAIADQFDWFLKSSNNNYEILGYGQAAALDKAKEMAFKDIIQTLKVEVTASTSVRKTVHNESFDNHVIQNLNTSSSAVLIGAKVKQAKQVDGIWYVSVVYDTGSIGAKFKRSLKGYKLKNERPNYLTTTNLISSINNEVGTQLKYEVLRKSDLWLLRYKDIEKVLTENDFINLFRSHSGKYIKLNLNKKIFYPQDQMSFHIDSKNTGYVSMLYVEANGKVGVLYANKKSHTLMRYPEKNSNEELTIANPYKKILHEMYIALWSPNKVNLSSFEDVQSDYLDSSNYKFHKVVELLDKNDFSSVVVKIKY